MVTLKMKDIMYMMNPLEEVLENDIQRRIEFPVKGFHTLYARKESVKGTTIGPEWPAAIAYIVGGGNCGIRYSAVAVNDYETLHIGVAEGFRFPVAKSGSTYIYQDLLNACRGLQEKPLLRVDEVEGFNGADSLPFTHKDGWYTKSIFTYEYDISPDISSHGVLGDGAHAYSLREGVYVVFPDKSFRLIPYKEFFR